MQVFLKHFFLTVYGNNIYRQAKRQRGFPAQCQHAR